MKSKSKKRKRLRRRERGKLPFFRSVLTDGAQATMKAGRSNVSLLTMPAIVVDAFLALFLTVLLYRLRLYTRLYSAVDSPFSFAVEDTPVPFLVQFIWQDLAMALLTSSLLLLIILPLRPFFNHKLKRVMRPVAVFLISLLIVLISLGHFLHYHLIFFMNTGLVFDLLVEAAAGLSPGNMLSYASPLDFLFLALPLLLFWVSLFLPHSFRFFRNAVAGIILINLLAFILIGMAVRPGVSLQLSSNPLFFLFRDALAFFNRPVEKSSIEHSADALQSIAFTGEIFTDPGRNPRPSYADPAPYNVVFLIMESTGASYIFDVSKGNQLPMPFVKKLADEGLYFQNHFSTSNSSARSLFSIFSGIYVDPQVDFYVTRPEITIPSFFSFVKGDSFLLTPGSLGWYFPRAFFYNSSLKDMRGFDELKEIPRKNDFADVVFARDERLTTDLFIKRLHQAAEPFYGVYYSVVPHWPYTDYGPEYDVSGGVARWKFKYYNNLRLLDTLIEKIYNAAQERGILDRTIFVLTGDHGEAFGQHEGNFLHSRASYNENVKVPLIIHAPFLLKPRQVLDYTSHADILPTLLDLLQIDYNPLLFQGESLQVGVPQRKYIFFYGNEDSMSAIDRGGQKTHYDFKTRTCTVYDLSTDPGEMNPGRCPPGHLAREAILYKKEHQMHLLTSYNSQARSGFHGKRHPALAELSRY